MNSDVYKRKFDLTILVIAHLALLPLFLILWTLIPFLIWLDDRGPVFYRQQRIGKHGRVFTILKFRSMVPGADQRGPAWTSQRDPRVTRVGRLLRRTALDELPEILSIWKGDMSLVGPRALEVEEHAGLEQEIPGFRERLKIVPGLTGLAQVYNRADNSQQKFHYDLEYLQRMSPVLDIKLLVHSVWNTVTASWDQRSGKPTVDNGKSELVSGDTQRSNPSDEKPLEKRNRRQ